MSYSTLEECVIELEKNGQLVRIKEEVNPYLEMAAIHLRVHQKGGPAILFENVKNTNYRCVSNLFGTLQRSEFIFKNSLSSVKNIIEFKNNPLSFFKKPFQLVSIVQTAIKAIPLKNPLSKPIFFEEIQIQDLPLITHWKNDGGAFVTLPQVYTEDIDKPGIMHSNLGMYRIQLNGNEYELNKEIGLHYQLHRGIGVHQTKANLQNKPLKVSIFIGGPPSHTVSAVMPLPEGMSEISFAGILANKRFKYVYENEYCISTDADFVITGEVIANQTKPEGPFGDHLGYYSLTHPFPVMKVHKVFAKKNAIWPFTVVGRPPQEDTSFGHLIHAITGNALQKEIPGLKEVNAVDAAGVHPLLLAIGSERYTPYLENKQPAEILTIANRILGTGQLSLAKFLFITADDNNELSTKNIELFFEYILQRINLSRDIHFYTHTTIDTLDYSGSDINSGSKVVLAAYGKSIRNLANTVPACLQKWNAKLVMKGVVAIQMNAFSNYENAKQEFENLSNKLTPFEKELHETPLIIVCDDASFTAENMNNFLWVTFTRCNPSHDMYGIQSFTENKHWGCKSSLIFDARIKPHHAPILELDAETEKNIERFFTKGGVLEKWA